jgi:hypothetical protein
MHLQIPRLGIVKNLADVVDWSLYDPDSPGGGGIRWIDLHWLGSQGFMGPRTRRRLQELGPGGMLTLGT